MYGASASRTDASPASQRPPMTMFTATSIFFQGHTLDLSTSPHTPQIELVMSISLFFDGVSTVRRSTIVETHIDNQRTIELQICNRGSG
ncbi:hypothetical protein A3K87_16300 [Variovorax paradoxus]|uniref:Uncharacterized protein n=1 Tax=Variovorax paradoxus TaxID=34073 RepID=A0AA91DQ88_VARPD|nr:hypothetical protein A3K87_16300 [Variovorax paradoxus]CKS25892.1 Uncharacterised protein [Mycobacterium tuberculosis]